MTFCIMNLGRIFPTIALLLLTCAALLIVPGVVANDAVSCNVQGYDLSVIPQAALQILEEYNGATQMYSWVVNLCQAVSAPPSGQPPCTVSGFITEYSTSHCETAWNSVTSATAGANSLVMVFGQAGSANHLQWTATVTLTCAGTTPDLVSTGNVMVTGPSTSQLDFAFAFTTSAVCSQGPTPPPGPGPTPSPPTPQPPGPNPPPPNPTPAPPALPAEFFAVLQDRSTGEASCVTYDATGNVVASSSINWAFRWPLVEVSADTNTQTIHVITYPLSSGDATLFKLSYDLQTVETLVSSGLSYFDLEFSPAQNTFYGIAVTSAYGRELSVFTNFTNPVQHTPITSLPYMWYVNASTIDPATSRYFGLLNNFPGFPSSSSRQILAVGDYGTATMGTAFLDLMWSGTGQTPLLRFISFSAPLNALFGLANSVDQVTGAPTCVFVSLNTTTGEFAPVLVVSSTCVAEPMFASRTKPELVAFLRSSQGRMLLRFDLSTRIATYVQSYDDDLLVSGVTALEL